MVECPLCQSEALTERYREEIDDSLECLLLNVAYECDECGNEFDVVASFSEPSIVYG